MPIDLYTMAEFEANFFAEGHPLCLKYDDLKSDVDFGLVSKACGNDENCLLRKDTHLIL